MSSEQVVVAGTGGGGGGSFFGLLFIVSLVLGILKVNDTLEISWWLVTLPIWICFVIAIVFTVVVVFVEGIRGLMGLNKDDVK